jgi:epoxyqueuosine reductase QueG
MASNPTELRQMLHPWGADLVHFLDISHLPQAQNRNLPVAVLIVKVLDQVSKEAFNKAEQMTDRMADRMAEELTARAYSAYSQSEKNLLQNGMYAEAEKRTPLPHKTLAGLAGWGWIGKHGLIIHPEFGSAISMCSVLTDAPLNAEIHAPLPSRCGDCVECKDACQLKAIKGNAWHRGISRDELVDVFRCNSCYQCVSSCPWTVNSGGGTKQYRHLNINR